MKHFPLVLAFCLVLVACGDDSADPATTTAAPTSTTAPAATTTTPPTVPPTVPPTTAPITTTVPTTTTIPSTTTTTVPGSPFTSTIYGLFPAPLGTAADGHGSGCVLAGNVLTDGMWWGFVEAIGGGAVTFDLGCFFTGAAGHAAAAADGEVGYDLDFYLRNQNPKTFSVPLDPSGTAYWLELTGGAVPSPIAMGAWPMPWDPAYQVCPADHCSVWLYVNGGIVTELIEQYLP